MTELVALGALIANIVFLAWVQQKALVEIREANKAALRDKASLISLVREAQDRIQAQTLTDFVALRGSREPSHAYSRSDSDEARIANRNNGGARE